MLMVIAHNDTSVVFILHKAIVEPDKLFMFSH